VMLGAVDTILRACADVVAASKSPKISRRVTT
jgi:hypothetical protein